MIPRADVTGLVLAGGRGARMGGADKGLQDFRGLPLALHALRRIYGRDWKARLLAEWITAPDGLGHPPELCALRRSHGPSWLLDYTLPDR